MHVSMITITLPFELKLTRWKYWIQTTQFSDNSLGLVHRTDYFRTGVIINHEPTIFVFILPKQNVQSNTFTSKREMCLVWDMFLEETLLVFVIKWPLGPYHLQRAIWLANKDLRRSTCIALEWSRGRCRSERIHLKRFTSPNLLLLCPLRRLCSCEELPQSSVLTHGRFQTAP